MAKRSVSHVGRQLHDEETGAREGKAFAKCVRERAFLGACSCVCVCFCVHVQEGP